MYRVASFKVPYFNDLEQKEFSLGVPTDKYGNILIGATGVKPNARLRVEVGEQAVTLNREDGQAIQIVEHGREDNPVVPKADFVLSQPVDEVTMLPAREDGHWSAEYQGQPLEIEDPIGFESFAKKVADEALTKQIKARQEASV